METRSTPVRGRLAATWALGSLAVFLCAVEALTGLGLAFHYRPTLELAYASVLDLREASGLGWVVEIHYWGSHALVVAVWLHLVRTFVAGSYRSGHRRDWMLGVVLLVPVLLLAATGSQLTMDSPAAGRSDGDLWRVVVLHCVLLPAVAAALVVVHVRGARRRAGLAGAPQDEESA